MALLLKPNLERLMASLPTTEPIADDKVYLSGPFLALSGVDGGYDSLQETLVSGTNIKTINSTSVLGSGNFTLATATELTDGLATKQATLVSGTNIKTINGESVLGSGNLTISGAGNVSLDRTWTLPASSLNLVTTTSLTANAGYEEHGLFRFWNELNANTSPGSGWDYSFAIGWAGSESGTNVAKWTQEVSYDPNGTYKSHEMYMTYQHPSSTYWPTPRRNCWGLSTFSNNRGNIANPVTVGFANLDQVQFSGLQPSVSGSKAGWRYAQMLPNYQTGAFVFELTSETTNYSQLIFTLTSTGTAINTTGGFVLASAGGSLNINWGTAGTSTQSLQANAGTATLSTSGVTVQITSPTTYGGGNTGLSVEHTATTSGFAHFELYTKASNQIAALSFSNRYTQRWSLCSRGDASDAFQIWNRSTGTEALTIAIANNAITTTGKLTISASTTTRASFNIPSGTAPTSPADNDIWNDGSDLKVRLGGTTYTLQKV